MLELFQYVYIADFFLAKYYGPCIIYVALDVIKPVFPTKWDSNLSI